MTLGLEKLFLILFFLGIIFLANRKNNFTDILHYIIIKKLFDLSILQLVIQCISLTLFSIFCHELGHLLFAINRNVLVPSISLQLKKGLVCVDTTGMQFMNDSNETISILSSGPFINFILFQYSLIGSILTHSSFLLLGSILNFFFFLQNMCILFNKTDGQKILTELVKSNTFVDHMHLFFYIQNRKKLKKYDKFLFDFIWIQKVLLLFSVCLFIFIFVHR